MQFFVKKKIAKSMTTFSIVILLGGKSWQERTGKQITYKQSIKRIVSGDFDGVFMILS
jgi:hypothetical protein